MNSQKFLGGISLMLMALVLVACQSGARVGEPVSNGTYEITIISAERQSFATGVDLEVLVVTVDIEGQLPTDIIPRAEGATVTDSEEETYEAQEYHIDDHNQQRAYFVFVLPKSARHLKFHFDDFPVVNLE